MQTMDEWLKTIDSALETACSHQNSGNTAQGVGTESLPQDTDLKENLYFCSHIPTVPLVLEEEREERHENSSHTSFIEPDGGGLPGESAPAKAPHEHTCRNCEHFAQPGLSDGLCGGRPDLPPAFGPGHPLRQLPADHGADCQAWALHPFW
jgi:hypothetical protein